MVEGTQGQGRLDGVMSEYGDLVQAAIMVSAVRNLKVFRAMVDIRETGALN